MDHLLHSLRRKRFWGSAKAQIAAPFRPLAAGAQAARQGAGACGPAQAPASLCPLLSLLPVPMFPALPFHPEKFAGRMSSMGFSFTQENQKKLEDASFADVPPWHPWSYL